MKEYQFTENTLFHSIGFNLSKLESILTYGILSEERKNKLNSQFKLLGLPPIPYAKNYQGTNEDKYISMVAYPLINPQDLTSAYNKYTTKGIGFIIEKPNYHIDKTKYDIHRNDEVWVEDIIPLNKIKGIIVPEQYRSKTLDKLTYLPLNATKYESIKANYELLKNYLKEYNYNIDEKKANEYLKNLYLLSLVIQTDNISQETKEYQENYNTWKYYLQEFNDFLSFNLAKCMNIYYQKEITLIEMVEIILKKHNLNLPIYDIPVQTDKNFMKK